MTKTKTPSPPRISAQITPELMERKNKLIPYGMEFRVFQVILTQLFDTVEKLPLEERPKFWAALLEKHLELNDYLEIGGKDDTP